MRGVDRYIKILLIVFQEKKIIWGIFIFLAHFLLFDWTWLNEIESGHCYYWIISQDMISFMITTGSL